MKRKKGKGGDGLTCRQVGFLDTWFLGPQLALVTTQVTLQHQLDRLLSLCV
jgi:hypothetical protein